MSEHLIRRLHGEVEHWHRAYLVAFEKAMRNAELAGRLEQTNARLTKRVEVLEAIVHELVEAIEAPRYGDSSIWDDLNDWGAADGGPLGRARAALEGEG